MKTSPRETIEERGSLMKKVIFASVMAMGLVACGGGNKEAALSKAFCMDGSSTQAQCDCMAKAAVDELDPKLQNMLLKASKAGDEEAAGEAMMKEMANLSSDEQAQFGAFAMKGAMTCATAE